MDNRSFSVSFFFSFHSSSNSFSHAYLFHILSALTLSTDIAAIGLKGPSLVETHFGICFPCNGSADPFVREGPGSNGLAKQIKLAFKRNKINGNKDLCTHKGGISPMTFVSLSFSYSHPL